MQQSNTGTSGTFWPLNFPVTRLVPVPSPTKSGRACTCVCLFQEACRSTAPHTSTAAAVDEVRSPDPTRLDCITRSCPGTNCRFLMPARLPYMKFKHTSPVGHRGLRPHALTAPIKHQASSVTPEDLVCENRSNIWSDIWPHIICLGSASVHDKGAAQSTTTSLGNTQYAQPRRHGRIL